MYAQLLRVDLDPLTRRVEHYDATKRMAIESLRELNDLQRRPRTKRRHAATIQQLDLHENAVTNVSLDRR